MFDFSDINVVKGLVEEAQAAEKDQRQQVKDDTLFIAKNDGQWEPYWWTQTKGKPRYTFDQTSPIVDQIAGEIEESDFDIQIKPSGGNATKDLALLRDGMIRNIETMSDAQTIYSDAGRNIATGGLDHWLVSTGFINDDSFDQDLIIEPIYNSVDRVWFDLAAQRRDREDATWGVMLSAIPLSTYREKFPDRSGQGVSENMNCTAYIDKVANVIIANFFYQKMTDRVLIKTSMGRTFEEAEYAPVAEELAAAGETEVGRRTIKKSTFYLRKYDGDGWIGDEEETVFSTVPIIPVYANYRVIENKPIYFGAVRKVVDPQRVLNYSLSREIEEGALAPRAKLWMTQKQAKGHLDTLATLNTNSDPVQFYNPDPEAPGAPPQTGGAMINPGLRTISEGMQVLMGQTAGIFAAGMGDNPGLQSGVAIEKLQRKGNNVTGKYFKALEIAICRTARLLNEALPKVYDAERQARILKQDGSFELTTVNQKIADNETGKEVVLNDLSAGKYDITCKSGPSFDSQQSETVSALLEVAGIDPGILQIGSDVLLGNISAPGIDQIADRSRQQLLSAGVIPEEQMSEEEKEQIAAAANQPQQPDAMMVAAQAEQAKADAEMMKVQIAQQKNQIEMMKAENQLAAKVQELQISAQKVQLAAQKQEIDFAEKAAKFDREGNKQAFDQMIATQEIQRQAANDAIENLNKQADTLGKIKDAMGVDTIIGPGNQAAYVQQSAQVLESQNQT